MLHHEALTQTGRGGPRSLAEPPEHLSGHSSQEPRSRGQVLAQRGNELRIEVAVASEAEESQAPQTGPAARLQDRSHGACRLRHLSGKRPQGRDPEHPHVMLAALRLGEGIWKAGYREAESVEREAELDEGLG
ncbi:MAG: hypothetical protein AB1486_28765 [Planctomycetota bacterium]